MKIDKVKRLYEWAREPLNTQEQEVAMRNFNLFFKQHDMRRNTNINKVFPELHEFIDNCEALNARH